MTIQTRTATLYRFDIRCRWRRDRLTALRDYAARRMFDAYSVQIPDCLPGVRGLPEPECCADCAKYAWRETQDRFAREMFDAFKRGDDVDLVPVPSSIDEGDTQACKKPGATALIHNYAV